MRLFLSPQLMPPRLQRLARRGERTAGIGSRDDTIRSGRLPPILSGRRRRLFSRLVLNGSLQAGATVALPFVIDASTGLSPLDAMGLLALLALVLMGLRVVELADAERLGLDYVAETRLALYDGIMSGKASTAHGVAMSRLMNDLSALRNWVGLGLARSVTAALALLGCLAAAAVMSLGTALAIGVPIGLAALAAVLLYGPLEQRVGQVRNARGRLARLLGEALLGREMLVAFGETARLRRRVAAASTTLTQRLRSRIVVAAMLRALADAVVPGSVIAALALGLPLSTSALGLVLLAGIAVGPLRQALRAIEYRAAYRVGRQRLAGALVAEGALETETPMAKRQARVRLPALLLYREAEEARCVARDEGAIAVTADAPLLRGSLRRNLDITRRLRGNDPRLAKIAEVCELVPGDVALDGLDERLDPDRTELDEEARARLSLARALASGAAVLLVDAPALIVSERGRALLQTLPGRFAVRLHVVARDAASLFD